MLRVRRPRARAYVEFLPAPLPCRQPAAAAATHMAEDHGLSNGDGPVDITQGLELLVSAVAQDVILLDGVQCLLLTLPKLAIHS